MKNIFNKHKAKIIFIIILIFQVIAIIYAASQRVHLHMDEYLSFGFISSEDMYINKKEDFYNTWHTNDYFYEYLEVNESEVNNFWPVYENQKNDVHPPLYYLLLRIFNNFSVDNFTIWLAIALNVVLFIISMCIVYLIGKKIFKNKKYTLLLCFIVGFNIGVIQIVIYIRMYQLLVLSVLLLLYWHLCYGNKKEKLRFTDTLKLLLIVCMGLLTQYYFLIILAGFYIVYFIQNIKDKQYKNLLKYTLTLILSVTVAILIFPHLITHLLFSGRGEEAYQSLLIRPHYLFYCLWVCFKMISKDGFNFTLYGLILILICFIIGTIYYKIKNKDKKKLINDNKMMYVVIPTIFYFIVLSCIIPYVEIRYFSIIIINIMIILLYYLKIFGEYVLKDSRQCFNLILIICVVITFINLLKINDNIFTYKKDAYAINNINNKLNLIYIYGNNQNSWYDAYEVFLNYENSIVIKNNENVVQDIIKIISEKKLRKEDYVIGIDKNVYVELKEKLLEMQDFKDLEFDYGIGRSVFLINKS